jgi:hypothetical protein
MSLRDTPASAISLEEQHRHALTLWTRDLNLLEAQAADLLVELEAARSDALRENPDKRPSSMVGTDVARIEKELNDTLKQRDNLQKDVTAKRLLLQELEEQAQAERNEAELEAAQAQIADTEEAVATNWAEFVRLAKKLRDKWGPLAASVQQLDALPAGNLPMTPFPGDLVKGLELALKEEEGKDPFRALSRVMPRRLSLVTSGSAAVDTTGFGRTMRDTGDYR